MDKQTSINKQLQQRADVWFITGASKGFGLKLVNQLLGQGHRVAATSRDVAELRRVVGTESAEFYRWRSI